MDAKRIVHTCGRIEELLGCAFDLFRFAMVCLDGWGEKPELGRRESDNWVGSSPTGRTPINCQLAASLVPLTHSTLKNGLCSSRIPQKGTFLLSSTYPIIIFDDACRPALPSSALLLRPVSYRSPRSSPRSKSGLQSSFLLSRKRYARVMALCWLPNFLIDVTFLAGQGSAC